MTISGGLSATVRAQETLTAIRSRLLTHEKDENGDYNWHFASFPKIRKKKLNGDRRACRALRLGSLAVMTRLFNKIEIVKPTVTSFLSVLQGGLRESNR